METLKRAVIGTVSAGTMRIEDLLSAFADELGSLVDANADVLNHDLQTTMRGLIAEAHVVDPDSDDAGEIVSELFDALNTFAPEDCYFGAHEGDGSDYGYWPDPDVERNNRLNEF